MFSVALSLALRPVGVTDHPAQWSPDFPLPFMPITTCLESRKRRRCIKTATIWYARSKRQLSRSWDRQPASLPVTDNNRPYHPPGHRGSLGKVGACQPSYADRALRLGALMVRYARTKLPELRPGILRRRSESIRCRQSAIAWKYKAYSCLYFVDELHREATHAGSWEVEP